MGSITSGAASVTVTNTGGTTAPVITANPVDVTVAMTGRATFSVQASTTSGALAYQWFRVGAGAGAIAGATAPTYTLTVGVGK